MRGKILDKAKEIINKDRQDAYGNPEDCFREIAFLWTWWLKRDISLSDVAMMMVLLKQVRERHLHKEDNIIYAAGYLGLYEDLINEKKKDKVVA